MKRIELDVMEDISKTVIDMLKLCNGVEVVSMGDVEMATEEQVAACVAQAIAELRADKMAFRSYDFTWILVAINEYQVEDIEGFRSPQAFVDYLRLAGVEKLPDRTTLRINNVEGVFPNWQFDDTEEPQEVLRRINIVKRFLSAYRRAKKTLYDRFHHNSE
jgi:hypothetical protein